MINEYDKVENKLNAKIMTLLNKIDALERKVNALFFYIIIFAILYVIYKLI